MSPCCKNMVTTGAAGLGAFTTAYLSYQKRENNHAEDVDHAHIINWSGTHECNPRRYYEPNTVEAVEEIVANAHKEGDFPEVSYGFLDLLAEVSAFLC